MIRIHTETVRHRQTDRQQPNSDRHRQTYTDIQTDKQIYTNTDTQAHTHTHTLAQAQTKT